MEHMEGKMQDLYDQPDTARRRIEALSLHDPLVHASLAMSDHQGNDWQTTCELLVLQLADARKRLEDQLIDHAKRCTMTGPFPLPKELSDKIEHKRK